MLIELKTIIIIQAFADFIECKNLKTKAVIQNAMTAFEFFNNIKRTYKYFIAVSVYEFRAHRQFLALHNTHHFSSPPSSCSLLLHCRRVSLQFVLAS